MRLFRYRKKWNFIHAQTIKLKLEKYTQREIADRLDIKQPSVQRRLISAGYYMYEYYTKTIQSGVEKLWKEVSDV